MREYQKKRRDILGEKQFFFFLDDSILHEKYNVYRNVSQVIKYPEPVLIADHPWEEDSVSLHQGTVLYCEDEKLFKMWYFTGRGGSGICYATSKDGLKWEKPSLGIYEHKGSRDNNIVLSGEQAGGRVFMPSIIKKGSGYEMYIYIKSKGLYRALSDDGLHWNLTADRVLSANEMGELGRHSNDQAKVEYNPITAEYECYHACLIAMPNEEVVEYDNEPISRRVIGKNLSKDGINWTDTKVIVKPDEDDPSSMQFYGMIAWAYRTRFCSHPFHIGLLMAYNCVKQVIEIELVCSNDGEKWTRVDRNTPILPRGQKSCWDEGLVMTSCCPVRVGDEYWIYYTGRRGRHTVFTPRSIGMARLRLDRFASLDCPQEGYVVTRLIPRVGEKLSLNLDASKGVAYVEVLDPWFSPIKSFTKQDCDPITADSTSKIVTWKGNSDLSTLEGRRIRLKFYLEHTDLYLFSLL